MDYLSCYFAMKNTLLTALAALAFIGAQVAIFLAMQTVPTFCNAVGYFACTP